ncbi:hypothetical protein JB92DRAFT_1055452 [Gautieria morchelliformis]|nr:hypothetical protein JB92DRAFT_1055452 [Gautieria morchelliformis]
MKISPMRPAFCFVANLSFFDDTSPKRLTNGRLGEDSEAGSEIYRDRRRYNFSLQEACGAGAGVRSKAREAFDWLQSALSAVSCVLLRGNYCLCRTRRSTLVAIHRHDSSTLASRSADAPPRFNRNTDHSFAHTTVPDCILHAYRATTFSAPLSDSLIYSETHVLLILCSHSIAATGHVAAIIHLRSSCHPNCKQPPSRPLARSVPSI